MNLGDAVYREITRRSPRRSAAEEPAAMARRAQREAGGVSQLARAIGVARTTVQRWNKGSTPSPEAEELLRAYLRPGDISRRRAEALTASNSLKFTGRQGDRKRARTINLTPYLEPGTMGRAVEAYLRGADRAQLWLIVWSGITDRHYRWMLQPPGGVAQRVQEASRARSERLHRDIDAAVHGDRPGGGGGGGGFSGGGGGDSDDEDDELGELDEWDGDESGWGDLLDDMPYLDDVADLDDKYGIH